MGVTTRSFNTMLNEYLPNSLLMDELIKRDWFLTNVQKDNNWKGGDIIVPFQGNAATSVSFGGLTDESKIHEYGYVRGKIDAYKEAWGSLVFNHADLMQHDGKIKESTFLRILPDQVDAFLNYMKMVVSINLMGGPHFAASSSVASAASGIIVVDHIDRFEIGQEVVIVDATPTAGVFYVIAINVNSLEVTLSATKGGSAANLTGVDLGPGSKAYADTSVKFYTPGIVTGTVNGGDIASPVVNTARHFNSLKSALLSQANGGSANLHGQSKLAYPYLQAVNISGSTITAANILEKLFDAFTEVRKRGKAGKMSKCVMSYKHLGSVMKALEDSKQSFKVSPTATRASVYDWTEIDVTGVRGSFTIVGVQEMDDDVIMFLDMAAMTFRSNGFFKKRQSPEGNQYYELRATTGYKYIVDICLFGELELTKPTACGIIYGISY